MAYNIYTVCKSALLENSKSTWRMEELSSVKIYNK